MKKIINCRFFITLILSVFILASLNSCTKSKACERNNTYSVTVENHYPSAVLQVNVDKDFVSINGTSDYSIPANSSMTFDVASGKHTIYAKTVVTTCSGGRCSTSVSGKTPQDVDQRACEETTLVF